MADAIEVVLPSANPSNTLGAAAVVLADVGVVAAGVELPVVAAPSPPPQPNSRSAAHAALIRPTTFI
ncbi:hypothetical protein [Ralstonia sp. A12]|uniref:hypothetical protein n=1 Tax=Ralstonia sp. A12 TaxID=1217052 RepID=UPI000B0A9B0D|nr:hypothetical protein [Ralstonia sp. A12]